MISVLLTTYNRAGLLKRTLDAMSALVLQDITAEIIVADNNSTDNTKEVIESFQNLLPIKYCFEPKQGKNVALNRAVELARGALFIFTDDDVLVDPNWLVQWNEGTDRWPNHDVFGGPVLPEWPCAVPDYFHTIPFFEMTFSGVNPKQEEGPFAEGRPIGPNMAIRRRVFDQERFRFNENVGPSEGNYIMGSETELLKRLETAGHEAIYLPSIGVRHIIRAEQLIPKWLYGRAYRYGRALRYNSRNEKVSSLFGLPRYLLRFLVTTVFNRYKYLLFQNRSGFFRESINYWMIRGQLRQAKIDHISKERE